ncbi:MAG: LysR family transcriptional regulator [Coriobacteriales bacterium]|jgi:LysR family hca operon transcriptional activator
MNTGQLETFVSLARTLNYATTAREMFVTQPAVSQQISALERELGVRLFDRTTKHVALTEEGSMFYADCLNLLSGLEEARVKLRDRAGRRERSLSLGCSSDFELARLDQLLRAYRERMPSVHLRIDDGNFVDLLGSLHRRWLDAAFGVCPDELALPEGIAFCRLHVGRMVCVVPKDDALAGAEVVTADDLGGRSLILLEEVVCPPEMREVQDQIVSRLPSARSYLCSSSRTSVMMVRAGMGVAVMPDFSCPRVDGIATVRFGGFGTMPYGLLWNTGEADDHVRALVECATQVFGAQ